jgi:hypothetical protein
VGLHAALPPLEGSEDRKELAFEEWERASGAGPTPTDSRPALARSRARKVRARRVIPEGCDELRADPSAR